MIAIRLGRLDIQLDPNRIAMTGRIDDASPLGEVLAKAPRGAVTIDTSGVTFINSIGMREWIRLIRGLRDRGDAVVLERVADVLMTQMNLIPEFRGIPITSFHAQYVCPACGAEAAPIVDAVVHAQALRALQAPRLPCPECKAQMELGDFPERYLTLFGG
jgi:hypothetical protein